MKGLLSTGPTLSSFIRIRHGSISSERGEVEGGRGVNGCEWGTGFFKFIGMESYNFFKYGPVGNRPFRWYLQPIAN